MSARRVATLALLAFACERYVPVGYADALVSDADLGEQKGSPPGAPGGAGGAPDSGGAGEALGGAAGEPWTGWSADQETGDFTQWLSDLRGRRFAQASGTVEITEELARSGTHAIEATISATDGELHQAVMGRDLELAEGRYGAWYFLPVAPQTLAAVIMKLSNGGDVDRYDIDLVAVDGEVPRLRLYEHESHDFTSAPAVTSFPIGQWVHVEALYRSTPSADGRVIVLQDGNPVLDSGARPTAKDAQVVFFCGISSHDVDPAPFRVFIDDVSIAPASLP
ncbi:MAG: hypothetical protein EOO73_10155 [Myxococcales bacterium]|nr:MAG: hypothetical protein EOO73_10155 [Myxococcales bacterium]